MIAFRVDANEHIATGHLMRCMAIASQCRKLGQECLFILAQEKECHRLQEKNFPYVVLHSQWDDLESELTVLKKILKKENIERLVVDSYQVTKKYLTELNQQVSVLYIDDMGDKFCPVDMLLRYGVHTKYLPYQKEYKESGTVLLEGEAYIPLREEFFVEEKALTRENPVKKNIDREKSILITTGGTDFYHISGKVLSMCESLQDFDGYDFHVIVGSMNQHKDVLKKMAKENPRIHLHENVKNMSEFMRTCQMAISAGGTTLFELCACGIPTVCFSFADNQEPGTKGMEALGAMHYAGDARKEPVEENIVEHLVRLIKSPSLREDYSEKMQCLVDGKGAYRIAKALCFDGRNEA